MNLLSIKELRSQITNILHSSFQTHSFLSSPIKQSTCCCIEFQIINIDKLFINLIQKHWTMPTKEFLCKNVEMFIKDRSIASDTMNSELDSKIEQSPSVSDLTSQAEKRT